MQTLYGVTPSVEMLNEAKERVAACLAEQGRQAILPLREGLIAQVLVAIEKEIKGEKDKRVSPSQVSSPLAPVHSLALR